MGYITLQEYMTFAGISSLDSNMSSQVSILIDTTTEIINNLLGDLSYSTKSEEIRVCDIEENCYNIYPTIQLSNINVESLEEINGLPYTGQIDEDYQIIPPLKSRVVIRYLSNYLAGLTLPYFNIKYKSGYETIPNDIKYLQYLLVKSETLKQGNQEVKSYNLGPRSVTFKDKADFDMVNTILSNYSIPII